MKFPVLCLEPFLTTITASHVTFQYFSVLNLTVYGLLSDYKTHANTGVFFRVCISVCVKAALFKNNHWQIEKHFSFQTTNTYKLRQK
jgi:hypothetical protein